MQNLEFTDWHGTMMPLLWAAFYRLSPGPQGMLAFLLACYWGGVLLITTAVAEIDRRFAPAMLVAGFLPFTINFLGTIWTDVLLATSWLICAGFVFVVQIRERQQSAVLRVLTWTLFGIGCLARANSMFAAIPLGLYVWRPQILLRPVERLIAAFLLVMAIWLGNWAISYPLLNATQEHAIDSILTYDLAGISYFSKINYLPSQWSMEETEKIVSRCYTPLGWDAYGFGKCKFVRKRLQEEGLWGSWTLWHVWFDTIKAQPLAYLRHRSTHFLHFMTASEYVFHAGNSPEEVQLRFKQHFGFRLLYDYVSYSQRLWMFHPIFWFLAACLCLLGARRCSLASQRFITALASSSLIYLGTYFFVGVASDFRYAYWAVLATVACAVVVACEISKAASPQQSGANEASLPGAATSNDAIGYQE